MLSELDFAQEPAAPALISIGRVDKRFGNGTLALSGLSLEVGRHQLVSLLGPSGCGKSTVLRLVAGLDAPSAGHVEAPSLDGAAADTAFVFQQPTLLPWASVFDNVWLPLRLSGVSRRDAAASVLETLATVSLAGFESALPDELSGGMQMRVSIARALVTQPRVLLMDEPFAALDEITRQKLNADLLRWWQDRPTALIFVTHSVFEAVFLSQRVLVMSARPGRVTADFAIDEPYPRNAAFRTSLRYSRLCGRLSEELGRSHADGAGEDLPGATLIAAEPGIRRQAQTADRRA